MDPELVSNLAHLLFVAKIRDFLVRALHVNPSFLEEARKNFPGLSSEQVDKLWFDQAQLPLSLGGLGLRGITLQQAASARLASASLVAAPLWSRWRLDVRCCPTMQRAWDVVSQCEEPRLVPVDVTMMDALGRLGLQRGLVRRLESSKLVEMLRLVHGVSQLQAEGMIVEGGIHSCCDDPLHVAFAERMRYYHLGRLLSLGCPVSWRWLTAASMGRALSDPMMRDGLRVRLGLPLVRCVGAEAGQPGPFGPRLMDTLGVGFRIDPNYGAKCCLHEPAKYALVRGFNGVPERAAGSAGLRPDVWCLADGVSLFFDVSFVEGVSYQNTSTAQVVESRGLCFASERVESKLAKYLQDGDGGGRGDDVAGGEYIVWGVGEGDDSRFAGGVWS